MAKQCIYAALGAFISVCKTEQCFLTNACFIRLLPREVMTDWKQSSLQHKKQKKLEKKVWNARRAMEHKMMGNVKRWEDRSMDY